MIPCTPSLRLRLIRVSQQLTAPDLLIRGCRVWNAFSGEIVAGDVAVCEDRIARVGPWQGPCESHTQILEATGRLAVPGYIEPHTHPWPFVNPLSLGEAAVCRGTSCLVFDDLLLHLILGTERLARLTRGISQRSMPLVFWVARMASQSRFRDEEALFSLDNISRLLRRPEFLAIGEMTRWTDFLAPDLAPRLLELVEAARTLGKFADGHTAGASARRLSALAATGIRSCHEAIEAGEALDRVRQGLWVLLRNSSLRRDLSSLLPVLDGAELADRFTYTTDGAKAHHVEEFGFTDHLIRTALDAGVTPSRAYRMATLNAASFLKLDEDLGSIAPGKVANINLLRDIENPTPHVVVCRGQVAAADGSLKVPPPSESFDWQEMFRDTEPTIPTWGPDRFAIPAGAPNPFPAGRLVNAVITRESPVPLAPTGAGMWPVGEDRHVIALTDRSGGWISWGVVEGMGPGLAALATTYTTNAGVLALGTSPQAMSTALARLARIGGGMVVVRPEGEPQEFPLPLAGLHLPGGFPPAAREARAFQRTLVECGYGHADPNYTLLFLSCDFLPEVRATEAGWIRVKTGEVLWPSEKLG